MYHLWIGGVLTGGNKEIWITIPLNKPILGTPKVTLKPTKERVAKENGSYYLLKKTSVPIVIVEYCVSDRQTGL